MKRYSWSPAQTGQVRVFLLDRDIWLRIEGDDGHEMEAGLSPQEARKLARQLERFAWEIEKKQKGGQP